MGLPKVSVIIPNYNHGRFLKQRIESVINQTYPNFEVIILDDCSSYNSLEIISEYADNPNIKRILLNDSNSGSPFKQWKQGVELASGDWLWFAESDDYADQKFLETMITALGGQDGIGLLYCNSMIVIDEVISKETFADIKNRTHQTIRWSANYRNQGLEEIEDYLLAYGTINNASAVLFNNKVLKESNPFDVDLKYIGDKYTYIKVLSRSDIFYVREALNYYRDPFNFKHEDKLFFLFREQFLVFSLVHAKLEGINKMKFFEAFYAHTNFSVYRNWDKAKWNVFANLFSVNPWLLIRCIAYNIFRPFLS